MIQGLKNLLGSLTLLGAIAGVNAVEYTFNIQNSILAPDGFNRSTVVVNGQFPGTLITATKGEDLNVKVVNQLEDPTMRRSTSIHWHGFVQHKNAQNDGPAFVTQCPISPENEYTYKIDISDQAGTYWYHSHLASQYLDGLRGPIVIKDPQDPNLGEYNVDDETTVITLGDWFHDPAPGLQEKYLSAANNGVEILPQSGTINGVGRTSTDPAPSRPVFKVESGKKYRYRIINISAITNFDFQIQGHSLKVIEADGISYNPLTVDTLTIFPGMRYSVVVEANQAVDNYWIHAPMSARAVPAPPNWATDSVNVNAVLHYDGAPDAEPTSNPPATITGTKLQEHLLVPSVVNPAPGLPFIGGADKVFNLTFESHSDATGFKFYINGTSFHPSMNPSVPTLLRILADGAREDSDFPVLENTRTIKRGDVVEISIAGRPNHPFHLHGHSFHVVKGQTGPANFVNPPIRDVTPTAGAAPVVIRFVADNPGPWILHCHIDMHLEAGLAMVFAEDTEGIVNGADNIQPSQEWQQLCDKYNALDPSMQ